MTSSGYRKKYFKARVHEWYRAPLTLKEMEVFLALIIAVGICGFPTLRYRPRENVPCNVNVTIQYHWMLDESVQ